MSEWQPIATARPEVDSKVLIHTASGSTVVGYWFEGFKATPDEPAEAPAWQDCEGFNLDATHWMPLPEPPA